MKHIIYFTGKFVIEAEDISIAFEKANKIANAVLSNADCDEAKMTVNDPSASVEKRLERKQREIDALRQIRNAKERDHNE